MDPLRFAPRMTREANVWIPSRADAWSRMTPGKKLIMRRASRSNLFEHDRADRSTFFVEKRNAELKSSAKSKSQKEKNLTASERCVPQGAFASIILCKIIFFLVKIRSIQTCANIDKKCKTCNTFLQKMFLHKEEHLIA